MQRSDLPQSKQPSSSKGTEESYNKMKHKGNAGENIVPTQANASESGTEAKNTQIRCIYYYHAQSQQLLTLPTTLTPKGNNNPEYQCPPVAAKQQQA